MELQFTAEILQSPKFPGAGFIEIPFSVEEVFGVKGQVKVKAYFDGHLYRGSIAKMGHHCHILVVTKEYRTKLGKTHGDTIMVEIERDTEERVVEVPKALQDLLDAHPSAKSFYESLSYTNRKEYARWIADAKREATRLSRLEKTLDKLQNGLKNPSDKGK